MTALARFDALLQRRQRQLNDADLSLGSHTPYQLISPEGEVLAQSAQALSHEAVLRCAYGLEADDWIGALAEDSATRTARSAWRLALIRADRHGQARLGCGPQWLSLPLRRAAGEPAAGLRKALLQQAVAELWAKGWRLQRG
ncbi:hypothetical protein ACG0Z6_08980 [Roseateles sp. BYS180W]|uniref:Uncharacterized protein n=1 Tax=Roseateles rivi TaxID=3299028 RepID=A0ABW7FVM5_9BURK